MTAKPISLGMRSNSARDDQAGIARLINCYAEETEAEGKSLWTVYGAPGLRAFGGDLGEGPIRAAIEVGGFLYVVSGTVVSRVSIAEESLLIGGVPTTGPVYMARNRAVPAQIGIVSGGTLSVVTGTTVTEIKDPDLPSPRSISYLDGFGIMPISGGRYMISAIDDFTTVDGLDIGVCEAYPDEILRAETLERDSVFFGTGSLEWHQNTGDADFPLSRSSATELGCLAAGSVAKCDTDGSKTLIWVAPDHTVRRINGYAGAVISTHEIAGLIRKLDLAGRSAELTATSWADGGRFFYALSCDDWTRVYDSKTGAWHERRSEGMKRWRVGLVIRFGSRLIAGDAFTGKLYEMRDELYSEDGETMVSEIITPNINAFPYRVRFNGVYIDVAKGVGRVVDNLHNQKPELLLSWSDDNGASWQTDRFLSLGAAEQRLTRLQEYKLGSCGPNGRHFRLRISADVRRVVMSMSVDFDRLGK